MTRIRRLIREFLLRRRANRVARMLLSSLLLVQARWEMMRAWSYFATHKEVVVDNLLPDFLGVGAQKSATTWLDSVLRRHPDVTMPAGRKEIHFFDGGRWKGLEWYAWHFRHGVSKLKGEITPAYSILTSAQINEIVSMQPRLKVILLLRNPVERAWSMAAMDLFRWRQGGIGDAERSAVHEHLTSSKSLDRGRYSEIVSKWRGALGSDRVFIGFYEEVEADPSALLKRLFEFLGISSERFDWRAPELTTKIHEGGRPIPPDIERSLSRIYHDELTELAQILDSPYPRAWLEKARRA